MMLGDKWAGKRDWQPIELPDLAKKKNCIGNYHVIYTYCGIHDCSEIVHCGLASENHLKTIEKLLICSNDEKSKIQSVFIDRSEFIPEKHG